MRRVIIETPYAGDIAANVAYARACMRDSLKRGEAPFASHLLYPDAAILNDALPEERELGITAGLIWGAAAECTAVYVDRGISPGMRRGIAAAHNAGRPVFYRTIRGDHLDHLPWGDRRP